MNDNLRLVAVGDVLPNSEHPEAVFELTAPVLNTAAIRYCQVECTFSESGILGTDVRNPAHRVPSHNSLKCEHDRERR